MLGGDSDQTFLEHWGFTLKDLYALALKFFKEKDGKAMHFTYQERLQLLALASQASNGKFDPSTAPPLGVLDVIGRDRRLAWQALGDKSKPNCMSEFIMTLDKRCPQFKPFVEAHKARTEMTSQNSNNTGRGSCGEHCGEEQKQASPEYVSIEEEQKRRIQDALNRQTFEQFKSYAEKQFPSNPEQQAILIRQLQEQHYNQYMRQIYQQNLCSETNLVCNKEGDDDTIDQPAGPPPEFGADENGTATELNNSGSNVVGTRIASASMWTRKDIKAFKESVWAEGGEAIIRINQGESVTVRVPTHQDGSCLFWEFATDSYDIGFGLFFEWTDMDEPVSIQVTEENSSEEEDDEAFQELQKDVEKGRELLPKGAKPNTEVIIPVYRRDAHLEVYVGSHIFPGKGVYLLKFDNSYSFWRSKTLYYRVYYTK